MYVAGNINGVAVNFSMYIVDCNLVDDEAMFFYRIVVIIYVAASIYILDAYLAMRDVSGNVIGEEEMIFVSITVITDDAADINDVLKIRRHWLRCD